MVSINLNKYIKKGVYMKELFIKYKEAILYLVFGVLTTLINIIVYALSTRLLEIDVYTSNVIAWVLSVLFAYITNRKYVFNSKATELNKKIKELLSFYSCRLLTFGIDMLLMFILIDLISINDMISKIIVNIIIIILNYILSKFLVFKNNN
ncbi:MAG: GtrA family protein [Bacilli bacterium]|nr:GtrA family protein [Bacilli bacterium]